jgi:hypothetical protein
MAHPQRKKMAQQKRTHLRKLEHQTSVIYVGCRPVLLEASPCSPEPQETQRKTQRTVKSSKEQVEKQVEHQRCRRSISGGTWTERMGLIKDNIP